MSTPSYIIRSGIPGRERLRILAPVMWPTTRALLERVRVAADARILDLGCGGGDVTVELAALAPVGEVVGVDLDETQLAVARDEAVQAGVANVKYRAEDVTAPSDADERFDVVYCRFLLTHLPDPSVVVEAVRHRLAPAGVLIVEDIDCRGHFSHPSSAAFDRYVEWYAKAAERRGVDPNIGPRLPSLLADAGFRDVEMNVVQPAGATGEVKLIAPITLAAVADAVVAAELASPSEVQATIDELHEFATTDGTVLSLPRIVQAWGRVPG